MSKIDLSQELAPRNSKRSKKSKTNKKLKKRITIFSVLFIVFGFMIITLITKTIQIPFQIENRNQSIARTDSIDVNGEKIKFVKKSFLQILEGSFWDHENYTDINYSNKNIGLAVNNVFGYQPKKQTWSYELLDGSATEIVSVKGTTSFKNVKYTALVKFQIQDNNVLFFDMQLKEYRSRRGYLPASERQKIMLIQKMYRN